MAEAPRPPLYDAQTLVEQCGVARRQVDEILRQVKSLPAPLTPTQEGALHRLIDSLALITETLATEASKDAPAARQPAADPADSADPGLRDSQPHSLLRRLQATPSTKSAASILAGSTESMALEPVFHFLSSTHKTGILHVETDTEHLEFEFLSGGLLCTHSSAEIVAERLGNVIVALGFADAAKIEQVVPPEASVQPLGELLTAAGILTPGQLQDALAHQAWSRFERATAASAASFQFFECEATVTQEVSCVSVTKLLLDYARLQGTGAPSPTNSQPSPASA